MGKLSVILLVLAVILADLAASRPTDEVTTVRTHAEVIDTVSIVRVRPGVTKSPYEAVLASTSPSSSPFFGFFAGIFGTGAVTMK